MSLVPSQTYNILPWDYCSCLAWGKREDPEGAQILRAGLSGLVQKGVRWSVWREQDPTARRLPAFLRLVGSHVLYCRAPQPRLTSGRSPASVVLSGSEEGSRRLMERITPLRLMRGRSPSSSFGVSWLPFCPITITSPLPPGSGGRGGNGVETSGARGSSGETTPTFCSQTWLCRL